MWKPSTITWKLLKRTNLTKPKETDVSVNRLLNTRRSCYLNLKKIFLFKRKRDSNLPLPTEAVQSVRK